MRSSPGCAFFRIGRTKVGAAISTVACSSRIASIILRVSSGLGMVTTFEPRSSGYQSVTVKPKLWKTGRHASKVHDSGRIESDEICAQLARMLRCVRATPLGSPELPLVNSRPASARSPTFGTPSRPAHHWLGSSQAASSHGSIARLPPAASISVLRSSVRSGQGKLGTLGRIASAEITVFTPPSRRLVSRAARPAVKFRFTGTFPAQSTARLAMNAPAPVGSTIPTRCSGTVARIRRDNTAVAAYSWPQVSSRRCSVRSTIASRPGCFVIDRTHSRPRWRRRNGRSLNDCSPRSSSWRRAHSADT